MSQTRLHDEQDRIRAAETKRIAAYHAQQLAEVQGKLNALQLQQQAAETKLRDDMKARDKLLWQRVESVIKMEEDKVKARLEKEKKAREEEERLAKEAELKRRLEEEKKKEEEERKRKEAEEAQRLADEQKKKEEEDERARIAEEKEKTERLNAEEEQRNTMGMATAEQDWHKARDNLIVRQFGFAGSTLPDISIAPQRESDEVCQEQSRAQGRVGQRASADHTQNRTANKR
jgi:nucleoporin GLE1